MDMVSAGSTTFKREELGRGIEPDASSYLQHAAHVRGKVAIDLDSDALPDLVIEIDITHPSLDKFPIYAAIDPIKSSWGEQLMFADGPPSWWTNVVGDRR
jgi:Uma2 family endonuclease